MPQGVHRILQGKAQTRQDPAPRSFRDHVRRETSVRICSGGREGQNWAHTGSVESGRKKGSTKELVPISNGCD